MFSPFSATILAGVLYVLLKRGFCETRGTLTSDPRSNGGVGFVAGTRYTGQVGLLNIPVS